MIVRVDPNRLACRLDSREERTDCNRILNACRMAKPFRESILVGYSRSSPDEISLPRGVILQALEVAGSLGRTPEYRTHRWEDIDRDYGNALTHYIPTSRTLKIRRNSIVRDQLDQARAVLLLERYAYQVLRRLDARKNKNSRNWPIAVLCRNWKHANEIWQSLIMAREQDKNERQADVLIGRSSTKYGRFGVMYRQGRRSGRRIIVRPFSLSYSPDRYLATVAVDVAAAQSSRIWSPLLVRSCSPLFLVRQLPDWPQRGPEEEVLEELFGPADFGMIPNKSRCTVIIRHLSHPVPKTSLSCYRERIAAYQQNSEWNRRVTECVDFAGNGNSPQAAKRPFQSRRTLVAGRIVVIAEDAMQRDELRTILADKDRIAVESALLPITDCPPADAVIRSEPYSTSACTRLKLNSSKRPFTLIDLTNDADPVAAQACVMRERAYRMQGWRVSHIYI